MTIETFTRAEGRDVVGSDSAESIGSVKGFMLEPSGSAFGTDADMIRSDDTTKVTNDHERAAMNGNVTMLGARVLTVGGQEMGRVDVEFDAASGAVVRVLTDRGAIESGLIRSLGSCALVVDRLASSWP